MVYSLDATLRKAEAFTSRLLVWFQTNKRDFPWRKESDPYRILVTEKLLQQTTFGHVMKVYGAFFDRFPHIESLARARVSQIEKAIRRLGFQRQRARQLKRIGSMILGDYGSSVPGDKESLLRLDGVGEYVASAVLCFAFGRDEPVIDVNVRRVTQRLFGWKDVNDAELDKLLRSIMLPGRAKELNWGLIDFSALVCSRKPKCSRCFANHLCSYHKCSTP